MSKLPLLSSQAVANRGAGKLLRAGLRETLQLWMVHFGCCPDVVSTAGTNRYDWDRFGVGIAIEPSLADVLVVSGAINEKAAKYLKALYDTELYRPIWVVAVGSCAISGHQLYGDSSHRFYGLDEVLPVDLYISGFPPRPEAVLHGILTLKDQIRDGGAGK